MCPERGKWKGVWRLFPSHSARPVLNLACPEPAHMGILACELGGWETAEGVALSGPSGPFLASVARPLLQVGAGTRPSPYTTCLSC